MRQWDMTDCHMRSQISHACWHHETIISDYVCKKQEMAVTDNEDTTREPVAMALDRCHTHTFHFASSAVQSWSVHLNSKTFIRN